ncbi:YbjN domain-containing protein [Corynebacterium tapiri]|uniref:YbjN domain-containing protein n=1 Tax=Corynebacterium tapiri TaxID=1448266 RepID=A0A5C4U2W2_9CORY|nr:YbjN domain-containing protein [Corynebacterium tapiri]TNL95740.1 YbjN domain-containing protein [Corynebacterium tapiri]
MSELEPLTPARIRRVLGVHELDFVAAEDGASLEGIHFSCDAFGVLTVAGHTPTALSGEEARRAVRAWHAEHFWPTCSVELTLDEGVTLHASVSVDYETGVADRQLDAMMSMALAKIREFFREVA